MDESPMYETPPWGEEDQPTFLNMAVKASTDLPPMDLRDYVKQIEADMGRIPSYRWGPRSIDIDILLYDDLILNSPRLIIPHPRMHKRRFVLHPICDIDPSVVHPVLGQTVRDILEQLPSDNQDMIPCSGF
jgi:2-amino-4-hydroxy-6-hydroxymethyldihydropteridine diphosphokinase